MLGTMKTPLCRLVLLAIAATSAFGQAVSPSDPLDGVWKLNLDKSKNALEVVGIESEVITIAAQGSSHKLTFDVKQSNDYNPHYYIVTDMKGGMVRPVNADGKATNGSWRVTRQSTKAFDMELISQFGGWTDKYEVSADGKTMTLLRVTIAGPTFAQVEKDGTVRRQGQHLVVFDRAE
jgi:hypothetical protein